jgi:peptidoglycan/xylan/chitin deacetylase (PgdA/CDA1 family)
VLPFQTKLISGALAEPYLKDPCQVISLRWDPQNSEPGTIVVPVMFHSIAKNDRPISDDTTITEEYFQRFIDHAHRLGFETITTAQLVDFLQKNARIPARSLLMIVDDRKRGEFFETYFFPNLKKYHWTVTNAWIAHPDTPTYLWKENEALVPSGLIDFQAHGVIHNTPIDENVSEAYARNEIYGAIQPIQEHFGKRPIAFIWPRGLFTPQAVLMAQEAGYQVGFTAYARGPLLFNWIPLGVGAERNAGNPLLVMPRYWSTTAIAALEESVQVSTAAQAFYKQQHSSDLAYYQQYCQGYPELSKP